MSDSVQPHRRQPTRLSRPWDFPGKNTGVGCHFLLQCMKVKSESEVTQSCLILSDPMDWSPPGSSFHGIFQARVLEWGVIATVLSKWRAVLTLHGASYDESVIQTQVHGKPLSPGHDMDRLGDFKWILSLVSTLNTVAALSCKIFWRSYLGRMLWLTIYVCQGLRNEE